MTKVHEKWFKRNKNTGKIKVPDQLSRGLSRNTHRSNQLTGLEICGECFSNRTKIRPIENTVKCYNCGLEETYDQREARPHK